MAEKRKSWFSSDEFFFTALRVFGYGLFFLGCYFQTAYYFPAANIFAFNRELLPLFGLIFLTLSICIVALSANLALSRKQVQALDAIGSIVEKLTADYLESDEEKPRKRNRTKADLDKLRRELMQSSELRIKESEVRLSGEWRFVVVLMVTILCGFLTLFLAVRN